jgi:hypothetical protein
MHVVAVCLVA